MHVGEVLDPIDRQLSFWLIFLKDANIIELKGLKPFKPVLQRFQLQTVT